MPNWGALGAGMKGLGRAVIGSSYGRTMLAGAGLGGLYGGFSDNTSIMGGALPGAALFGGARMMGSAARTGALAAKAGRQGGLTGAALWGYAGARAGGQIGKTLMRAYNPIKSTLKATFAG